MLKEVGDDNNDPYIKLLYKLENKKNGVQDRYKGIVFYKIGKENFCVNVFIGDNNNLLGKSTLMDVMRFV